MAIVHGNSLCITRLMPSAYCLVQIVTNQLEALPCECILGLCVSSRWCSCHWSYWRVWLHQTAQLAAVVEFVVDNLRHGFQWSRYLRVSVGQWGYGRVLTRSHISRYSWMSISCMCVDDQNRSVRCFSRREIVVTIVYVDMWSPHHCWCQCQNCWLRGPFFRHQYICSNTIRVYTCCKCAWL